MRENTDQKNFEYGHFLVVSWHVGWYLIDSFVDVFNDKNYQENYRVKNKCMIELPGEKKETGTVLLSSKSFIVEIFININITVFNNPGRVLTFHNYEAFKTNLSQINQSFKKECFTKN